MANIQMLGEVKYAPTRDIVYLFPAVIQTAIEAAIEKRPWGDLENWMKEHSISEEELAEGFNTYVKFISSAPEAYGKSVTQAFEESGWLNLRWQVRVVVMFYLSYVLSGSVFKGVRAAVDDEHNVPTLPAMIESGKQLDEYVRLPRWKKWWYRWHRQRQGVANVT